MNRPCAKGIRASTCPGVDDPTLNFSSETPDALLFSSIVYPGFDPYHPPLIPPGGDGLYYARDCAGVQYSSGSKLEADLLALAAGKSCQNPDPDDPNSDKFSSAQQSFTVTCYDGTRFTYTVPVGWYTGPTQAGADAQALAMAQEMAALQKSCCNNLPAALCLNEPFSAVLASTNRYAPFGIVILFSGTLPTGLTMLLSADRTQIVLSGTPTVAGTYTFTMMAANLANGVVEKTYAVRVIGINPTTLPAAVTNVDYSYQLVAVGTTGTVTFTVDSAMIPDWLTVDSSGLVSGTPAAEDSGIEFQFDVTIQNVNVSCVQHLSLTVSSYRAYFKLDESTGATTLVDQVGAFDLSHGSGTFTSIAGKLATAMDLGNGINTMFVNGPSSQFVFTGDFSVRIWFKKQATGTNQLLFGVGNQWQIQYLASSDLLEFIVKLTVGTAFVDTPVLVDGAWNHLVFWFEEGVGVGVRINDSSTLLGAGTDLIKPYATETLYLQNSHFWAAGNVIDEIAIWDHKLTAAEITADWNGGAGVTYP